MPDGSTEATTTAAEMLAKVKKALKITTNQYDDELEDMIQEAVADLKVPGLTKAEDLSDPLTRRAVITYCRIHHGSPEDYDRLQASYREQKGQMRTKTGYTEWGDGE